jgi:predicted cobalt transporter CbtA
MSDERHTSSRRQEPATISEVIDYVKTYAKQETIGPLRGAGRWIGVGAAGATALGIGLCLLLLGLLRLLQTETGMDTSEYWSWAPYGIVFVVGALFTVLAVLRVNKTYLDKKDKP